MPADPELLFDGPADAPRAVALAHGTGAGLDSPFLEFFAKGLGGRSFRVVRYEYPYMASKRFSGTPKPPDREADLKDFVMKINEVRSERGLPPAP